MLPMLRFALRSAVPVSVAIVALGCIVPKPEYDAAVRDANQAKAALTAHVEQADERQKADQAQIKQLSSSLAATEKSLQEREQQLSDAGVTAHNMQAKLDEAVAMNQELRGQLTRLGKNVDQLLSEKGALTQSVNDMKARLETLRRAEQAAESRMMILQRLTLQLKPLGDAGFLAVTMRDNRVTVTIPNDKLYDGTKAELNKTGEAVVKQIALVLQTYKDRRFEVRAHTDSTPFHSAKYPSNWDLSAARSAEVVRRLVGNGVRSEGVSAAAYAESDPVAANDTAQNKARNRRTEVVLVAKPDELVTSASAARPAG
jgi:chemotaxis protein MotB